MFRLEKEIRSVEIIFITALIVNILLIMGSAFYNIWSWIPFLIISLYCIPVLIKKSYFTFVTFDLMVVLTYIVIGSYFFL